MRLRHIKGCEDFVAASSSVAHSPEQYRGKWKEFFGKTILWSWRSAWEKGSSSGSFHGCTRR